MTVFNHCLVRRMGVIHYLDIYVYNSSHPNDMRLACDGWNLEKFAPVQRREVVWNSHLLAKTKT